MKDYRQLFGNLVQGEFPNIKAVNASSPNAKDGSPYTAAVIDDIWGFMQALMAAAGESPSGESEAAGASQLLEAMIKLFASIGGETGELPLASLLQKGIVQLSNAIDSQAEDRAATSRALNNLRVHITGLLAA